MEEEELTFKIRGCIFEVFRVLGAGFLEQVYQQALLQELELQGLQAHGQRAMEVAYKGNEAQLLNYLKACGKKVGLLVNFAHPRAEIRRFVL